MKHMNYKLQRLLHEGFSMGTLEKFSNEQLNLLYGKIMEQKGSVRIPQDADPAKIKSLTDQGINVEMGEDLEDPMNFELGKRTQSPKQVGPGTDDGQGSYGDGMPTESEIYEKAVSKKQRGLMGAAYSVEKGYKKMSDIPKSYRGKVKDVVKSMTKKQIKDFASTSDDELKEGFGDIFFKKQKREIESMMMDADAKYEETGECHYVVDGSWGKFVSNKMPSNEEQVVYDTCEEEVGNLEESILNIIQKHIPPHFTKKELLRNYRNRI